MPSVKPRVNLTLDDELNALFDEIAVLTKTPKATFITNVLREIALVRDKDQPSNVIPLIRVLEAEPVGIPYWAHKECLIAC